MEKFNLKDFKRGWVYGDFEPTLMNSSDTEVSIKKYHKGDYEVKHFHKVATEWTILVEGAVEMNGVMYYKDDIIKIEPNESTDFKCLTDVTTVVIKSPCVKDDKYLGDLVFSKLNLFQSLKITIGYFLNFGKLPPKR